MKIEDDEKIRILQVVNLINLNLQEEMELKDQDLNRLRGLSK